MTKIEVNMVPSEWRSIYHARRFMGGVKFKLTWLREKF